MSVLRVYADTSVFGGCHDPEFEVESRELLTAVASGAFALVVSDVTLGELMEAPVAVRHVLAALPPDTIELVSLTAEVLALRDAYLAAAVVGPASARDAAHIAAASVARVDLIVSWNFKHIVHYDKIRGYHGVNIMRGYPPVPIYSPKEVV